MKGLLFAFTMTSSLTISAIAQSDFGISAPDCVKETDKIFKPETQ